MKYLKVKLVKGDHNKGEDQLVYPSVWNPYEVDRVKIGPILYSGMIGDEGKNVEYILVCFKDDDVADRYIRESNGDIIEVSEKVADAFVGYRWEGRNMPDEVVTDVNRLIAILVKKLVGMELTPDDMNAIDPDKPTPGINRIPKDRSIFTKRI